MCAQLPALALLLISMEGTKMVYFVVLWHTGQRKASTKNRRQGQRESLPGRPAYLIGWLRVGVG